MTVRPVPFAAPFTLLQAQQAGVSRAQVRQWLEHGSVVRIAHGVYSPDASLADLHERMVPRLAVARGSRAVSFESAAAIHGLWTPRNMTARCSQPMRIERIPDEHIVEINGFAVPSAAWTAINLARFQQLPNALIAIDSALRAGVTRDELMALAHALAANPGGAGLIRAVVEGNVLAESALESWSRGLFVDAGLPRPVLQHVVVVDGRRYRVDLAWIEQRIIGEADGEGKFVDKQAEKELRLRQALIQKRGWHFVRFGWIDVTGRTRDFVEHLRRLLG